MDEGTEATSRLVREKALYRYSSALERGDFGTVAAILAQAEQDPELERSIREMNEFYQGEMAAKPGSVPLVAGEGVGAARRPFLAQWFRRAGPPAPARPRAPGKTTRRKGLVVGGAVAALALVLVVSLGLYDRFGAYNARRGSDNSPRLVAVALPSQAGAVTSASAEDASNAYLYGAPTVAPAPYEAAGPSQPAERLILRNGSIWLVVDDPRAAQQTIEAMVAAMATEGAYIVSSSEQGGTGDAPPSVEMSLRVPTARFDETMDRLAGLAVRVLNRDEASQDVTEEYVDLEARLEAMETARQRLLEIMGSAGTTKDLLQAEEQLTQREAEIESLEGRRQYLSQAARLASITVELQPSILSQPVGEGWHPAESVRRAFDALVAALRGFGDFLIFFAIAVLPWLLGLAVVIYVVVRLVLWRVRARQEAQN
jgi:hypothetical protein